MKNLKIFEDTLLRLLVEKQIIDKNKRSSLLKERIIKKTALLNNVYDSVESNIIIALLAEIYEAGTASKDDIYVNETSIADELFENYGVVLGKMNDNKADIYQFEPIFDVQLSKIENVLHDKELKFFVVSKEIFENISKDIRKGIEYKRHHTISTNEKLRSLDEEEVAIFFADELLQKCFEMQASDIHIEPLKKNFRVRMRLNGMLEEFERYDSDFFPALSSRIKLLSNLDIAERRKTQDGALLFTTDAEDPVDIPFRISVMPTIYGEKIVLRRLSSGEEMIYLSQLGMEDDILEQWKRAIKRPHGIILVSGPTGSGKSTTLFAAINEINKTSINITTVEDPVEFKIPGVNQVHIDSHKVSFADALRSILRQDPDVIMLGEIRDKETADTALRASLTGHMVFSTIHTNDAPSSATRLIDMGIEPFLVASSVVGILAQRLIRVLCDSCKKEHILSDSECEILKLEKETKVCKSSGCRKCNGSGYVSRMGVYEFLVVDDKIRQMINHNRGDSAIREYAIEECGMRTILGSAKEILLKHKTSYDEVMRIAAE